ncbi:venom dipeptidyl peptidase 4-like [Pectinophora gossypiella]|uniref:venom dipeptidyl peptidase 4-like n=1 Tax=Pectinophora gossypiella TaxID=13191 RepID=UPI00214F1B87|nr:venom dipeptidyl peptidase 4-like [Pectinophora gossypiella]XP_049865199.1 venom dipeptidyl peptidase 4-like [Pectinophora gossypiella]
MAENSNSTMEMGTSDQVLVATKRKKSLVYVIGGIAMVVAIGVVIALVVLLSGNEGGSAEDLINTTEGPTPIVDPSTATTITTTTTLAPETPETPPTTTEPPEPEDDSIPLEDIINGVFALPSFSGTWTGGNEVLFRNANGALVLFDVDTDSTTLLISNSSEILQQSGRVTLLSPDRNHVVLAYGIQPVYRHSFKARYAAVDILTATSIAIVPPVENTTELLQNFIWGPSGTSLAFVFENNIYYQSSLTSEPVQITVTGDDSVVYHGIPDWVYEEEVFGSNNAMWFSADGTKLAYATFNDTEVRIMKVPHYGIPGSTDWQYTEHNEIRYPKPGTTNPTVTVTIREIADGGQSTVYEAPSDLDQPILRNVRFVNNETIAVMWTNRVQTSLSVLLCTSGTETCTQIYTYSEENGWIDNIPLMFNEQGNSFITILPQSVDGVLYKQIVQVSENTAEDNASPLWVAESRTNTSNTVLDILLWTPDDVIWYKATHVDDSAEQHIYTVNATRVISCYTCNIVRDDGGRCLYNEASISQEATRVSVTCGGPDVPKVFIYDSNGSLVRVWDDNAETAGLVASRSIPEIIRLKVHVADGLPEADVQIQVPPNYQERTNVPLLVYVYGGPDSALVTKQWSIDWGTSLVSRWNIAVAHIDGRGSGLRGVANTFALNRQLGTVEIEDQIQVTKYLQDNLTWVDSNRTCIWGWSYGGYAASLALARGGDVFRCAAAVAPVVDWRFYDTIYTERYMDTPQNNTQAYINSSLLTPEVVAAYREKRYFLVHGTADDNVHYQHAMLISRLLQRQDVFFNQMSYTDEDHGLVGVRPHLYHALEKFLQENML